MDQLEPIRVDDAEPGRGGQEGLGPVLMGPEEAKEPRALGEPGKQGPLIFGQPAVERAVAHAVERMQEPQGAHRTGPEAGVGMCGEVWQMVIDLRE